MNNHDDYFAAIGFLPADTGVKSYVLGFSLSLLLTLGAYALVVMHMLPQGMLIATIIVLALLQFAVQAIFFLHLAGKSVSRERLAIFGAACVVVFILVVGSLWIMLTLNGRMMPSDAQQEQYMSDQGGF